MKKNLTKLPNHILKVLFYVVLYYSSVIVYLTYSIIDSPDFGKYYRYFEYYSGNISSLNLEQGHFYYFFNYIIAVVSSKIYELWTLNELLNFSIHLGNSLIFLVGCVGIRKYLSLYFQKNNIYLSLILACLLPASFELRATFKPEILAFACLGWLFYYLHKAGEDNNILAMLKFIILFSFVVTTKVSIAVLVIIILIFEIFQNKRSFLGRIKKVHVVLLLFFVLSLLIENYSMNGKFITQVDHEAKYDNQASFDFMTNFNKDEFIDNPNKYFFYDSFIGITLFDSFNDLFGFYNNSEHTELNKDRKQFFKVVFRGDQVLPINIKYDKKEASFTFAGLYDRGWNESNYIDETRMKLGFVFSSVIYFLCLIIAIYKKRVRPALLSPFIGMAVVSFSALGLFGTNNFDPNTGDSFKTFYYGFFIVFAFVVLLQEILKYNILKRASALLISLFLLFFIGFPFDYSQNNAEMLIRKNSMIFSCEINAPAVNILLNLEEEIYCENSSKVLNIINPEQPMELISFEFENTPYVHIIGVLMYVLLLTPKINKKTSYLESLE
jgi:hypothetical protein